MKNQDKNKIVEWLFINGKDWQCPLDWRRNFINMLDDLLEEEEKPKHGIKQYATDKAWQRKKKLPWD